MVFFGLNQKTILRTIYQFQTETHLRNIHFFTNMIRNRGFSVHQKKYTFFNHFISFILRVFEHQI